MVIDSSAGCGVLPFERIAESSAATHAASNCVPANRSSSAHATDAGNAARYARALVMASNASATWTMRASSGVSSPRSPNG